MCWTRCDLLTPQEFTRRAHAQPLAVVLILDATFQPHSMIRADVLCDSSVSFRVIRGSTLRFNRRVQRSNSQTLPPPNQGMTKRVIHPSRWLPMTLNANDRHQRMAGEDYPCQDANYRHSAAWLGSPLFRYRPNPWVRPNENLRERHLRHGNALMSIHSIVLAIKCMTMAPGINENANMSGPAANHHHPNP